MDVNDEGLVLTSRSRRGWTATFCAIAADPFWEDELVVDRWAPWRWLAVWRLRRPVRRWIAALPPDRGEIHLKDLPEMQESAINR